MGGKLGAVRKPPASARIEMEREDLGGTRKQNNRMGGRGGSLGGSVCAHRRGVSGNARTARKISDLLHGGFS